MLNFFSGEPKLPLIEKIGPPPNSKKVFLQLSAWDDEILSTSKIITFLVMPLLKLHEPALPNVIS